MDKATQGTLFLIPTVIADDTMREVIPAQVIEALKPIRYFLAEDVRTARRYLSSLKIYERIELLSFSVLNKDTKENELETMLAPIASGHHIGIISESGCPGIADPGALAVSVAHRKGITVKPLVGPSSILLALMGSGLNGQQFAFHGYLPIEPKECIQKIKSLEKESAAKHQTQILIETPFRNNHILKNLIGSLSPHTLLCVAFNLTGKGEFLQTLPVAAWKKSIPTLGKEPAVLFLAV